MKNRSALLAFALAVALAALLMSCPGAVDAQEVCRPEPVAYGQPAYIFVDSIQRTGHRQDKALIFAGDSLRARPGALVEVRGAYRMEWRTATGTACDPATPDPDPEPEPEPIPPDTSTTDPGPAPADDPIAFLLGGERGVGTMGAKYEEFFAYWRPRHEANRAARVEQKGYMWELCYYDCGLGWMAAGWQLDDQAMIDTGIGYLLDYRNNYVLPNEPLSNPRWAFPEGLAVHHLMTGDADSRRAVVGMANGLRSWVVGKDTSSTYRDGRIQGRAVLAQQMAYLLTGDQVYADRASEGVRHLLVWYDAAGGDGTWDSGALPIRTPWTYDITPAGDTVPKPPYSGLASYCDGMAPFQSNHALLRALIVHHELVQPVPRLVEILNETLDRNWELGWVERTDPKAAGMRYIIPPKPWLESHDLATETFNCEGSGSSGPSKDLSALVATSYAAGFYYTGETRHRDRALRLMEHATSGSVTSPTLYWAGWKQFNQTVFRVRHLPAYGVQP